jgi:hypothetical protein
MVVQNLYFSFGMVMAMMIILTHRSEIRANLRSQFLDMLKETPKK